MLIFIVNRLATRRMMLSDSAAAGGVGEGALAWIMGVAYQLGRPGNAFTQAGTE